MVYVREDEVSVVCGHGISLECMLIYLRNYVGVEITLDKLPIFWGEGAAFCSQACEDSVTMTS